MLTVDNIQSSYGTMRVLFGVSMRLEAGKVIGLLGRNGMGKTTTVKNIMGIVSPDSGRIEFNGTAIQGLPSYKIARLGLGLVPEGRQIFPNLTVRENLLATEANREKRSDAWTIGRVFDLFPELSERQKNMGDQVSGGEQQMLAIARALLTNPKLLIMDEATEGLAPLVQTRIWKVIGYLKDIGQAILIIDKNVGALTKVSDYLYVMEKGCIMWSGTAKNFKSAGDLTANYLAVSETKDTYREDSFGVTRS